MRTVYYIMNNHLTVKIRLHISLQPLQDRSFPLVIWFRYLVPVFSLHILVEYFSLLYGMPRSPGWGTVNLLLSSKELSSVLYLPHCAVTIALLKSLSWHLYSSLKGFEDCYIQCLFIPTAIILSLVLVICFCSFLHVLEACCGVSRRGRQKHYGFVGQMKMMASFRARRDFFYLSQLVCRLFGSKWHFDPIHCTAFPI